MPRVHFVKKARKDNPAVEAGESYYWWKFRFGPKRYSKTYPKRSQLTQSSFLSTLYNLEDTLHDLAVEDLTEQLQMLRDECECSLENMPEQLQDSSESGILLQDRIEKLEQWISEIEAIEVDELSAAELTEAIEEANPGVE